MTDLQRYLDLKEKADKLRRDADRAAGAEDQLKKRLVEEFGCNSVNQAKILLENLELELEGAEAEYEKAVDKFEAALNKQLEERSLQIH